MIEGGDKERIRRAYLLENKSQRQIAKELQLQAKHEETACRDLTRSSMGRMRRFVGFGHGIEVERDLERIVR